MLLWLLSISLKNATVRTSWEPKPDWALTRYREYPKFSTCRDCLVWIDGQLDLVDRSFYARYLVDVEFAKSYKEKFQHVDQRPLLKDPENPLNESEILAIWFSTSDWFWKLREDTINGTAGLWNCYFDFLFNATSKLAVKPPDELYSGITRRNAVAWNLTNQEGEVLIKLGEIVVATSPSSSSVDPCVAFNFMDITGSTPMHGLMFRIEHAATPVGVRQFSKYPSEEEYLFSPGTRLRVDEMADLDGEVLGCAPGRYDLEFTEVTLTELDPTEVVWKDGPQVGLTQTPTPAPSEPGYWASTERAKALLAVMIVALVLFAVFFVWTFCATQYFKHPCGRD